MQTLPRMLSVLIRQHIASELRDLPVQSLVKDMYHEKAQGYSDSDLVTEMITAPNALYVWVFITDAAFY